jgi:hypothetical protein
MNDLCWLVADSIKKASGKNIEIGYGDFANDEGAREMAICISNNIETETLQYIKKAKHFSIMVDESTDISTSKNLIILARYAERGSVVVKLLDIVTVESGSSDNIINAIKNYFNRCGLSIKDMVGFSSDGASTMTGSRNGVATQLKRMNSTIVDTHCAGHRLQLAITDAITDFEEYFVGVIKQTSAYFGKSSARKLALRDTCDELDEEFYNILKTVDTRWLSLGNCLKNIMKIYTSIMLTLKEDTTSILAQNLYGQYQNMTFKYWIAFMDDLCLYLNGLSKIL